MTTLLDVIRNDWARRNCYGMFVELDDLDPCASGDDEAGVAESVGCAFGSGTIEDDEIPLEDAVQTCHKIADRLREIG